MNGPSGVNGLSACGGGSVSCGGGRRSRRRICTVQEDDTYSDCTGPLLEGGDCNTDPCPGKITENVSPICKMF